MSTPDRKENVMKFFASCATAALLLTGLLGAAPVRAADELPAEVAETAALRRYAAADAPTRATRVLNVQDPVHLDETVKTAPRARAQIRFADGSIVGLGSDSELVVASYVYDTEEENGELRLKVKKGFFRVLGGAISKKEPIVVETPVATCGIRGSLALGHYDEKKEELHILLLKGELSVEAGGRTETISTPGHGTVVAMGAAPAAGHAFSVSETDMAAESDPMELDQSRDRDGSGGSGSSGGGCGGSCD
jgi:hypothetical protein